MKLTKKQIDNVHKDQALLMTVLCVRNTVIEDYHARGSLSQNDMKAFNKEVVNKIYTFLKIYLADKPEDKFKALIELWRWNYPRDWDAPELDKDIMAGIKIHGRS